jgi:hypothetical protein
MGICDLVATKLGNSPEEKRLKSVLMGRRNALRRGWIIGLGVVIPIFLFIGAYVAQNGVRFMGASILAAYFMYRVVASRFENQPRLVLLLRRFRNFSKGDMVIARILGDACRGLGVAITLQDSLDFPGFCGHDNTNRTEVRDWRKAEVEMLDKD